MNDSLLQLEVENLRELFRLKNLNKNLLDANYNLLGRIIQFSKEKGIPIDIGIEVLLADVRRILSEINPDQPKGNTKKSTDKEPVPQNNILIRYPYRTLR